MSDLIINRLRGEPIEFLDVSPEWMMESFDRLLAFRDSGKEHLDLLYKTDTRLQSARVDLDTYLNVEITP